MSVPEIAPAAHDGKQSHDGSRHRLFRRLYLRILADRQAAAAVEVGLLLPVFLILIFGILEIGLLLLYHLYLSTASSAGVEYLRRACDASSAGDGEGIAAGDFVRVHHRD